MPAKSIYSCKALLAPLAGVTDLPFRLIARECGLKFGFTEMLCVKPLVTRCRKTMEYLRTTPEDQPLGAQIAGRDIDLIVRSAEFLESTKRFAVIDVNCGCPVRKVIAKGEGSALLKEPELIEQIVKALVAHIKLPVTCKIRIGWSKDTINVLDVAKRIENAGATAITVHGRTKDLGYGGEINYDAIADVKKTLTIPVIGNGNVMSLEEAHIMFERTGCDHVMVARGAMGNPWLFDEIENDRPSPDARNLMIVRDTLLRHGSYLKTFLGEEKAVFLLRKVGCWYFKYFPAKGHYKDRMSRITEYIQFERLVEEYVEQVKELEGHNT